MTVTHLFQRAPLVFFMWLLIVLFTIAVVILYVLYRSAYKKTNRLQMRNLGVGLGGMVIATSVFVIIWTVLLFNLSTKTSNIKRDASSIYVSRNNLLLNWTKANSDGSAAGKGISGNLAADGPDGCFKGYANPDDPAAYQGYKDYIELYRKKEGTVKQFYEAPDGTIYSGDDDIDNQRKLSLAYYRFIYCTKTYYQEIANRDPNLIGEMQFLSAAAKANLIAGTSNCTGLGNIPDTQACTDGSKSTQTCAQNPCWVALNETIAAQCLLYDDHVYNRINTNTNPRGALASMEIKPSPQHGVPIGFQVRAAHSGP